MRMFLIFLVLGLGISAGYTTEYFVAPGGCDENNSGLSRGSAFATVQRGVDALDPGDTLTILPGEYSGSVFREGLGSSSAETVIRAEIPGTVVIRGDEPVVKFEPVDGYRFVYVANFLTDGEVTVVNEWDTNTVLNSKPAIGLLEFIPGSFFYDREAGKLYLSTADLRSPVDRSYTVSVKRSSRAGHGIELVSAQRVVLDGLAVTGFNANQLYSYRSRSMGAVWGILLADSTECVIRNCRVFMNSRGICVHSYATDSGGGNVVEGCVAWSNDGQYSNGDTGGLTLIVGRRDVIRDSISFNNGQYGVNIYAGTRSEEEASALIGNMAWGNGGSYYADIKVKTGNAHIHRVYSNIGLGNWSLRTPEHCLMGHFSRECDATNIALNQMEDFDLSSEFADPDNLDFRLQADSRFRGAGPNGVDQGPHPYEETVFYVGPAGDDAADGRAVATAWRTLEHAGSHLKAGDTLYLLPGTYAADWPLAVMGSEEEPIRIRGRGRDPVILSGVVTASNSAHLKFERLTFAAPVAVNASLAVDFHNCVFGGDGGLQASSTTLLSVTHCEFTAIGLSLRRSRVSILSGNRFEQQGGVAVIVDADSEVRYSDYNGYANPSTAWQRNGRDLSLAEIGGDHDHYSVALDGEVLPAGVGSLVSAIRTSGPYGTPLGLYEPQIEETTALAAMGPVLHSVSATTANVEWSVSGPTDVQLSWGVAGVDEPRDRVNLLTARSGGYSLTGLEPGSDYWVSVEFDQPVVALSGPNAGEVADQLMLAFTTAATPRAAITYYVAPDGNDRNDGLSRDSAFRTVAHAADRVGPGDTVLIAGGTYIESVYIRSSGEAGRPITFRAMPGEKVVFDGDERNLHFAFIATNKHHLRFDGLYFRMFGFGSPDMPWSDHMRGMNGAFVLYASNDVQISRCFYDGRGLGYPPGLLQAWDCADVVVENSVVVRSMGGSISFSACRDLRLSNNVFIGHFISVVSEAMNPPDMPFVMEHNIFTDNIPNKVFASLFNIGKIESMVEDANCYFLRIADVERRMFEFYGTVAYGRGIESYRLTTEWTAAPVFEELTRLSLEEYRAGYNPATTSIIADPKFAATLGIDPVDSEGEPIYVIDRLIGDSELDFPGLFATNPDVVSRGIGLQPEAFADFHFNVE